MSYLVDSFLPSIAPVEEMLTQVRKGLSSILMLSGESGVGKSLVLEMIRNHLLTEQELVIDIDLSDYEIVTPLKLITALGAFIEPILLESGFVQYGRKELVLKIQPYLNILKQALPKFYTEVIGADAKDNTLYVSEGAAFRFILNLLREALGADIPLFILIHHFEKASSAFAYMISELKMEYIGWLVAIETRPASEAVPSYLKSYQFQDYQCTEVNLGALSKEILLNLLEQWPSAQAWPAFVYTWIIENSYGRLGRVFYFIKKIENLLKKEVNQSLVNWEEKLKILSEKSDRLFFLNRSEKFVLGLATLFESGFGVNELALVSDKELGLLQHLLAVSVDKEILKLSPEGYYRFQFDEDKESLRSELSSEQQERAVKVIFNHLLKQDISDNVNMIYFMRANLGKLIRHYPGRQVVVALKMGCDYFYRQRDVKNLVILIEAIIKLSLDEAWLSEREQLRDLFNQLANESLLMKNPVLTQKICQSIYQHEPDLLQHCFAIEAEIKVFLMHMDYDSAQKVSTEYIRKIGHPLSASVTYFTVIRLWIEVVLLIRRNMKNGYPLENPSENRSSQAAARVLKAISGTSYVNADNRAFLPALVLIGVRWMLKKNIEPGAMYAFYGYQLMIYVIKEQYPLLFKIKSIGRILDETFKGIPVAKYSEVERACFDDEFYDSRTLFSSAFLSAFIRSLRDGVSRFINSYEVGLLTGDWEFSSYSSSVGAWYLLAEGHALNDVEKSIDERYETVTLFGYRAAVFNHVILKYFIRWVQGEAVDFKDTSLVSQIGISRNSDFLFYTSQVWRHALERDYAKTLKVCKKALGMVDGGLGLPLCPYVYFFYIYALVMHYRKKPLMYFICCLKIKFYLERLSIWSRCNAVDFKAHELLARALFAWFRQANNPKIGEYLQEALSCAQKIKNNYLSGLACELFLQLGIAETQERREQMQARARDFYRQWGLKEK